MRKDPLVGRPQATPPAADGAKLGGGLEGGRLLDFSGRQSRGWGRERVPPRHDCITIICILCGPIQVRISSINLTYINFTGIFDMSVPRSREACSALGTIARPSVYPAERRLGAHFNLPYAGGRAEPVLCGLCIEAARRGGGPAAARPLLAYTRLPARA